MRADAERLSAGVVMSDADRYLPVIYSAATAASYIPDDAIVLLDQPARCAERARDYAKQLGEDVKGASAPPASPPSRRTGST